MTSNGGEEPSPLDKERVCLEWGEWFLSTADHLEVEEKEGNEENEGSGGNGGHNSAPHPEDRLRAPLLPASLPGGMDAER